jgi:hypothetical protein
VGRRLSSPLCRDAARVLTSDRAAQVRNGWLTFFKTPREESRKVRGRRCGRIEARPTFARPILTVCVLFYGVVSAQTEKIVEFVLPRAEAAEATIDEVREDEPVLAGNLRVEAIELAAN